MPVPVPGDGEGSAPLSLEADRAIGAGWLEIAPTMAETAGSAYISYHLTQAFPGSSLTHPRQRGPAHELA